MSQAKHTPGPWDYYLEPSDHYKHKIRSEPGLICQLPGWVIHDELRLEQEANARLIAAAPELLEAAKMVLAWHDAETDPSGTTFWERVEMCRESEDALRTAVEKATGEAQ